MKNRVGPDKEGQAKLKPGTKTSPQVTHPIIQLQQTIGNKAVVNMIRRQETERDDKGLFRLEGIPKNIAIQTNLFDRILGSQGAPEEKWQDDSTLKSGGGMKGMSEGGPGFVGKMGGGTGHMGHPEGGTGLKGMPEGDSHMELQGPYPNMMPGGESHMEPQGPYPNLMSGGNSNVMTGGDSGFHRQGGDSSVKSGGISDNKWKEEDASGKW